MERRLAAILAADVVGYSQLMAVDEEATLAMLGAYREVTDALVRQYNGRVFSTAGDAFLAEFGSAVEAVRCAIAIQEDLSVRNAQAPEQRQMWFRIGINVGDVMIENEDLFGDGVNVAARLEGLADTGGVCISGSTFDQVKNKLSVAFEDIGAQKVKNIPEPIPAFRIVPGKVAVKAGRTPASSQKPPGISGLHGRALAIAGLATVVIILAGVYFVALFPLGPGAEHPFDGRWRVSVEGLSGCRDNSPRSFPINVREGKIDEPNHMFPKTGSISADGDVILKVTDQAGNLMNTQSAKITGKTGTGRFEGRRPSCTGTITMELLY